jgi:hypothetical protein
MTPTEVARKVLDRTKQHVRHPALFADQLTKEIAEAISEERELISKYLQFLNESIALEPSLVRHKLLVGSTRISTGRFIDEMPNDEHASYSLRLNSARTAYYVRD